MADQPPRLRALKPVEQGRAGKVGHPNLYLPTYRCRKCPNCVARAQCKNCPSPQEKCATCRESRVCTARMTQRVWHYRIWINGQMYPGSTGCRDERNAKLKLAQVRLDLERRANGLPTGQRLLMTTAVEDYNRFLKTACRSATQQTDQVRMLAEVLAYAEARHLDELDETCYGRWADSADATALKDDTRNRRLRALKRFGKWAATTRRLPYNPFDILVLRPVGERRERRAVTFEDYLTLLDVARRRPLEAARRINRLAGVTVERQRQLRRQGRVRALVYRFVGRTGLRRREVRNLRIGALDLDNGVLHIAVALAKARRRQQVLLGGDMIRRLQAYLHTLGPVEPTDRLFPRAVSGKYTFDRDLAAAGIPKEDAQGRVFNFHALRKTLVTHLRMTGADPDIARRFARHAARDLTHGVYTDETLLPLREAIDRLRVREAQVKRAMRARREGTGR